MKYTWEESDIVSGQWITYPSNARSDRCISQHSAGDMEWGVVNVMSDGWFVPLGTKSSVVVYLNDESWAPRPKPEPAHA